MAGESLLLLAQDGASWFAYRHLNAAILLFLVLIMYRPPQAQQLPQTQQPLQTPKTPVSRWARPVELVNTSLPAREAPTLVPGTLASLTRVAHVSGTTQALATDVSGRCGAVLSSEEFPSLGGRRATLPTKKEPMRSFAELSREWVKASEEDKKKTEEVTHIAEVPERVFRHRVISLTPATTSHTVASVSLTAPNKRLRKEDDGIGGTKEEWNDDSDRLSEEDRPTEMNLPPSDEDADEFNSNIIWDRRGKNEMY